MSKYTTILAAVGKTPLIRINALNEGGAEIWAKVEAFNPTGSAKDRAALSMIETAEKSGLLKPGATIVEPTSGNTGIGLAMVAAVKGYRLILTMPDTMSIERRKLLSAYGAELVLTPGAQGIQASVDKAKEIAAEMDNAFIPAQFDNPANPYAHYQATAPEIWEDLDGQVDCFVAGVGTGGTLMGVARFLKERSPDIQIVAVEPAGSPLLSGGQPGPHKIQGIGANFIPSIIDKSVIDRVMPIDNDSALDTMVALAKREALFVGISAGAAMAAALTLAKEPAYTGKKIVVVLPDSGSRYLSNLPE